MSESTCSVEACNAGVRARAMCNMHYQRLMKTGTTERRTRQSEMPCSVDECPRPRLSRGVCGTHYSQLKRRGELSEVRVWRPMGERFWSAVTKTETCWLFGKLGANGYGYFTANGKPYFAHRFAYEYLVGPIPDGLTIDHLCRVPACVNPAHLEPVTQWENLMRSTGITALNARKTECLRGHPFSDENTYYSKDGRRYCIACRRIHERNSAIRRRATG